jgi:acetyltransferase
MQLHHYLRPLLMPASIALVGASDRPASLGRILYENLLDGSFTGEVFAVNPRHRKVLGRKCHSALHTIGKPIDLVAIAAPCEAVVDVLEELGRIRTTTAIIYTPPPADEGDARRWLRDVAAIARKRRIRLLGPHAFGVLRPQLGLNASTTTSQTLPGRLALVAQSGAVCSAMLDFAFPAGIGFSTVVALGGAMDIGFGELLDALLLDADTDAILLYVETVHNARRFLSALRAAARTKPVVVLKGGRSKERAIAQAEGIDMPPLPDTVFDAALQRAGTVRARTVIQLFAAARMLKMGRIPSGDRLAIVTNGHGPGTLAADSAADRGVPLARFTAETRRALAGILPPPVTPTNPVNVRGDAPPERLAAAVKATLADPNVDAVLALHVPRPAIAATDAARAVANVARGSRKTVISAWLGARNRVEVQAALEAGGIANFYTPENAVEAFSFVTSYRRHQEWLLEVPSWQPEPRMPDLAAAERIRDEAADANRTLLTALQTQRLLAAFGLPIAGAEATTTLAAANAVARSLGYPVSLSLDEPQPVGSATGVQLRTNLRNGRMLTRAYSDLVGPAPRGHHATRPTVVVQKEKTIADARNVAIGVHTDPVFGPVITFGNSGIAALVDREKAVLLPPLNRKLALDLISGTRAAASLRTSHDQPADLELLVRMLLAVSSLVCALPWVRTLALDPVRVGAKDVLIGNARVVIDPKRKLAGGGYRHMAIHPYPIELVEDVKLRDGAVLHVRPIRPEDAELERAFVHGLSEQTKYFRFFYRLHELTPAMLARFTQVDYDRELALVAVDQTTSAPQFVAVARYIANPDLESAEFAVVTADAWQNRGVARILMQRLIVSAKTQGLQRLEGAVLKQNTNMIRFCERLGFVAHDDPQEADQVNMVFEIA